MNTHAADDVELSAGFADRVLALADRRLAQRRRVRWTAGASLVSVAVAVTMWWTGFATAPRPAVPTAEPLLAAGTQTPEPRTDSSDPLSYLFPDAGPVARFAAEDGDADTSEGAGALFDEQD